LKIPKFYYGQIEREVAGINIMKELNIPSADLIGFNYKFHWSKIGKQSLEKCFNFR